MRTNRVMHVAAAVVLALAIAADRGRPALGGDEDREGGAPDAARPQDPAAASLAKHGEGTGPSIDGASLRLLDAARSKNQSNSAAFGAAAGHDGGAALSCRLRVTEGGEGGAILFLDTTEHGIAGPAPHLRLVTEPNLRRSFAVGIDVHNPKNEEMFGPWGNYQGLPEREVSLHWDGREIAKRLAPVEFRGKDGPCVVRFEHVSGGAEVTVTLGGVNVYDREFVAGMTPYRWRPAFAAATRADATAEFDVSDVAIERFPVGPVPRPPRVVEVFHHVLTDNAKTAFERTVELPPLEWEFGRVLLDLEIHDAGDAWDEWDRCGELSVWDQDGVKRGIVPFITSYRTPCRWQVDVTHFRSWLTGKARFEIAAGTNFYKGRGYLMSARLAFHHGRTPAEAFRIVPLWNGTAHHKGPENHFRDFFETRTAEIGADVVAARVFTTTTGHSQVGEFTPSKRTIVVVPDTSAEASGKPEARFPNELWKSDCYLNPNRPQYGTWKFSRAGWAPGDVVRPWWIDLTETLVPGRTASLRYEPQPYVFAGEEKPPTEKEIAEASHNVRSYLILYRAPKATTPAPVARIVTLAGDGNAAKAGVKEGDFLATYDGRAIDTVEDLRTQITAAQTAKKEKVEVIVYRGSERLLFSVPPGRLGVGLDVK